MSKAILTLLIALPALAGCLSMKPIEFPPGHPATAEAKETSIVEEASILDTYSLPQPDKPELGGEEAASPPHGQHHDGAVATPVPSAAPGQHDHSAHKGGTTTMYTCPMHPEIVQDHEGACPKCGMRLVPKTDKPAGQTAGDGP